MGGFALFVYRDQILRTERMSNEDGLGDSTVSPWHLAQSAEEEAEVSEFGCKPHVHSFSFVTNSHASLHRCKFQEDPSLTDKPPKYPVHKTAIVVALGTRPTFSARSGQPKAPLQSSKRSSSRQIDNGCVSHGTSERKRSQNMGI